ncbi:MAG: hypothetical protein CMM84_06070 [Rhodothermaceae bacterium]|nr:hypothetical protein [Rhodothermaceae bacterium]
MSSVDLSELIERMTSLPDERLASVLGPERDDYTVEAVAAAEAVLEEREAARRATRTVPPEEMFECERCRSTRARARRVGLGGAERAVFVVVSCQRCGLSEWFDAGADRPGLRPPESPQAG